jgi:nitrogen fixation NifU-like protein
MASLYQSVIVEHDRSPRNFRPLADATHQADGRNPLCGDEVSVALRVDDDGRITDVAFEGSGCAVSRASASMMTMAIRGHTIAEAEALFGLFHGMLTGEVVAEEQLGKLAVFKGIGAFPMRVKCATLAWHAMKQALNQTSPGVVNAVP